MFLDVKKKKKLLIKSEAFLASLIQVGSVVSWKMDVTL